MDFVTAHENGSSRLSSLNRSRGAIVAIRRSTGNKYERAILPTICRVGPPEFVRPVVMAWATT
jgi:hypothetical protein